MNEEKVRQSKPLIPVRVQALWGYARRRKLVEPQQFDVLYLHDPQALPFFWRKRQPILYHIHGTQESAAQFSRYPIFRTGPAFWLFGKVIRYILEQADEFIVIDDESYELYSTMVPHRKPHLHLLPTAIDVEQFRPLADFDRSAARQSFGLPPHAAVVLFVGRLSWKKGVDLVLQGFHLLSQKVPHAVLAIAGQGEEMERMKALGEHLGVAEKTFFLGSVPHLPRPDLPRLYNCADVSVVASHHESLALVITEALACGVPVVSTPVGIAPKVIHNGITGFIIRSRHPADLADALYRTLTMETIDRSRCVHVARAYAETSKKICEVLAHMTRKSCKDPS
jgi:glycosyltransferase involved in cell wall biosynthesis